MAVEAIIFDLDGVIIDSESIWNRVRESLAKERGAQWHSRAHRDMMGMSAPEWSRYMHEVLGLADSPEDISAEVVRRTEASYRHELPLMKGAVHAVNRLAVYWPLAVASSSNRRRIDLVLEMAELTAKFAVTQSSEEVSAKACAGCLSRSRAAPHGCSDTMYRDRGFPEWLSLGRSGRYADNCSTE